MPKGKVKLPRVKAIKVDLGSKDFKATLEKRVKQIVDLSEEMAESSLQRADSIKVVGDWLLKPETQSQVNPEVLSAIYKLLEG